jgi:hypothetical protein
VWLQLHNCSITVLQMCSSSGFFIFSVCFSKLESFWSINSDLRGRIVRSNQAQGTANVSFTLIDGHTECCIVGPLRLVLNTEISHRFNFTLKLYEHDFFSHVPNKPSFMSASCFGRQGHLSKKSSYG